MKHDVHQCLIVIYISIQFQEILFSCYLVMANFIDFKSIQFDNNSCTTDGILRKLYVHSYVIWIHI